MRHAVARVRRVCKSYSHGAARRRVLDELDLDVHATSWSQSSAAIVPEWPSVASAADYRPTSVPSESDSPELLATQLLPAELLPMSLDLLGLADLETVAF